MDAPLRRCGPSPDGRRRSVTVPVRWPPAPTAPRRPRRRDVNASDAPHPRSPRCRRLRRRRAADGPRGAAPGPRSSRRPGPCSSGRATSRRASATSPSGPRSPTARSTRTSAPRRRSSPRSPTSCRPTCSTPPRPSRTSRPDSPISERIERANRGYLRGYERARPDDGRPRAGGDVQPAPRRDPPGQPALLRPAQHDVDPAVAGAGPRRPAHRRRRTRPARSAR